MIVCVHGRGLWPEGGCPMKILIVLATCLLTTSPALALLDYSPNSLGCYFDNDGNYLCFAPTPGAPFNVYFILANPDVENLGGFEFGWRCEPEIVPAPFVLNSVLPPGAINSGGHRQPHRAARSGVSHGTRDCSPVGPTLGPGPHSSQHLRDDWPVDPDVDPGPSHLSRFRSSRRHSPYEFLPVARRRTGGLVVCSEIFVPRPDHFR